MYRVILARARWFVSFSLFLDKKESVMVGQSRFRARARTRDSVRLAVLSLLYFRRANHHRRGKTLDEGQNRRGVFVFVSAEFNPSRSHPAGIRPKSASGHTANPRLPWIARDSARDPHPILLQFQRIFQFPWTPPPWLNALRRSDSASFTKFRVSPPRARVGSFFGNFVRRSLYRSLVGPQYPILQE